MLRLRCIVSCLFLSSAAALGAAYPVGARLSLGPAGQQHCLRATGGPADCSVIEETRAAYQRAVARMFDAARPVHLQLVLTVESAQIFEQVSGGLSFDLQARVRIESADGEVLDTISSDGRATVTQATVVPEAAARAAADAARDFEVQYSRSDAVASYLVGRRIAPEAAVTIAPRSSSLVWIAPGFGFHQGGDTDVVPAGSIRVGASYGWLMAQVMYGRSSPVFLGAEPSGRFPASLQANDLGLDLGGVYRPFSFLEVRAGPGIHYLFGSADAGDFAPGDPAQLSAPRSVSYAKVTPAVFASLSTTFLPFRNGTRFFAGIEGRGYFFTTLQLPAFGRTVPAADWSLSAMAGLELPWSGSRDRR